MPRGPRLDAPGTLHHVMVRGLERRSIFRTETDRADLLRRLGVVAGPTDLTVLAWALLPNHFHLLVRTGSCPLATAMRRLLTGYAVAFNRRHRRSGHLFQNRYKSIVVEEEPYLLELLRYIHLNPIRAGLVPDLRALDRYPWTGHSALMGRVPRPWQAAGEVLGRYGGKGPEARRGYRAFVASGVEQGRRPDLQGGGLRRSVGGWEEVSAMRRGRERWAFDERILGSGPFVERMRRAVATEPLAWPRAAALAALPQLVTRCAAAWGVSPTELSRGSRRRVVAHARYVASLMAVREMGLPIARVARALGVSPPVVRDGVKRGPAILRARGLTAEAIVPPMRRKPS